LMNSVHGAFKAIAKDKQIQFDCHVDTDLIGIQVKGDQMRLTQILFNLVGNAVKFTAKGFVKMEGKIIKQNNDKVTLLFKIQDTGIGIPEDRIAMIFDPFTQALSRTNRQYHGTGLGLTIAYRLVKLHGAELNLRSFEGKGTTFSFELQYSIVAKESLTQTKVAKVVADNLGKLKVLLAEDEPVNVLVLKKILQKWGIVPDVAANGKEAVDAVMKNKYDVILMDINMPVMDGFEAAKRIRNLNDNVNAEIPIIAVTASIGAAIEQISTFKYIDDCLLKPFKPEHLKEKLEQIVAKVALLD